MPKWIKNIPYERSQNLKLKLCGKRDIQTARTSYHHMIDFRAVSENYII